MKKNLNILFIMNFSPSVSYYWNTAELLYKKIQKKLSTYGIKCFIAYPSLRGAPRQPSEELSVQLVELNGRAVNIPNLLQLYRFIRENEVGLVFYVDTPYMAFYYLIARLAGASQIWTYTQCSGEWEEGSILKKVIKTFLYSWCSSLSPDFVLAPSKFACYRTISKACFPTSRTILIYNGIDTSRFRQKNNNIIGNPINKKKLYHVICCARAIYEKGIDYFIYAAKILSEKRKDIMFSFIGDGPNLSSFKKLVNDLELKDIFQFLGHRADIDSLLRDADISVIPSIWAENFGLTVVESMAIGLPTIATRVGGIPEIIESGISGLLIPPRNAEAIAAAIVYLMDAPELALRMGKNGRLRVLKMFDMERQVHQITNLMINSLKLSQ